MAQASKGILEESKRWINNFYVNEKWLDEPVRIVIGGYKVSDEVMDYCKAFYKLMLEGNMLSDITKKWLCSNLGSVTGVIAAWNDEKPELEKINVNTARSSVQNNKNLVDRYFKVPMKKVLMYPDEYLEEAYTVIDFLNRKYMLDDEYRHSMVVKLPKDCGISRELDDYTWVRFMNNLNMYSNKVINDIITLKSEVITPEMIKYYNYIISSDRLNDIDKNRLEQLRKMLGIE